MTERATATSPGLVLPDGTPWPDDAVEVAKVIDAWGVKGGIKLVPFSSDPQALFCTKKWFIRPAEPAAGVKKPTGAVPAAKTVKPVAAVAPGKLPPKLNEPRLLRVKNAKEQGDAIVATIEGLEDRNDAEALKGARVFVSRSAFPTPDEDEFYWVDLIGLNVVNREGVAMGQVVDLLDTGPHCVLRCVVPAQGAEPAAERLIPFVSAYIDKVSLADKLIVADWGLDY
jgi:16S rRNA processing protein RimM